MKGSLYTLMYAAALGTACATVLTFAAVFTEENIRANREAEEAKNILIALNVPIPEKTPAKELVALRKEKVKVDKIGDVTTYEYWVDGKRESVAVRFTGLGLWGPIKGFLAMDPERTRIKGITFYEQQETPGLGGEISKNWFRDRFKDLSLRDASGNVGIEIGAGEDAPNRIDGISGATMTCNKVEEMLNEAIKSIVKE